MGSTAPPTPEPSNGASPEPPTTAQPPLTPTLDPCLVAPPTPEPSSGTPSTPEPGCWDGVEPATPGDEDPKDNDEEESLNSNSQVFVFVNISWPLANKKGVGGDAEK